MSGIHTRSGTRTSNSAEDETQEFINHDDDEKDGRKKRKRGIIASLRIISGRWRSSILTVVVILLLLLGSIMVGRSGDGRPIDILEPSIHVVLYGSKNSTSRLNFCKTVLTTSVLDYSPPTFVNSTIDTDTFKDAYGKGYGQLDDDPYNTRSRIQGVLDALWSKFGAEEDDIVIVSEAFDTLLQLPSSVLLARYYKLNYEANRRDNVKQTIVFAARKTCSPQDSLEPWCYLQPGAYSLPSDMYAGPGVAKPFYLDPGFFMGPVKDVKELLEHAQGYQMQIPQYGGAYGRRPRPHLSDEAAFNMIFAEQQLYREMARTKHSTWYNRASSRLSDMLSQSGRVTALPERKRLGLLPSKNYDYHIGLDYTSSLVHVHDTDVLPMDSRFITYSHPPAKTSFDTSACTPRVRSLPADLAKADSPYHNLRASGADVDVLDQQHGWADVNLYTNICTGSVPAAILYRGNSTFTTASQYHARRQQDWQSLWLQKNAKQLLEAQRWRAAQARAKVIGGSMILGADSTVEDFDPAVDVLKDKVNVGDTTWANIQRTMGWGEVCGGVVKELFEGNTVVS